MFIDLMDMIISEKTKYSCETTNQNNLSCRVCDITPDKSSTTQNSSVSSELFQDAKHTTKGVSPFVGQMFGYLHS